MGHMNFNPGASLSLEERLSFFSRNFFLQKRNFEKVLVTVLNSDFTLLPISFSEDNHLKDYLNFASGDTSDKHVFSHVIDDFRFCYALDANLRSVLENNYNAVFIKHQGAVNLHLFFNHRSFAETPAALFLGDGVLQIMFKQNEKLVYYNVFHWTSIEDVIYYLIFALEQFGFDAAATNLALIGEISLESELVKSLKKYLKRIYPVVTGEPLKLHKELAQLPGHFYFTLLNQHTCEL